MAQQDSVSWISEVLARVPAHSFMAGLFVYCFLYLIPEKENWYWQQLEKARADFVTQRAEYESRKETQVKEMGNQCYQAIESAKNVGAHATDIAERNHQALEEIKILVRDKCRCAP